MDKPFDLGHAQKLSSFPRISCIHKVLHKSKITIGIHAMFKCFDCNMVRLHSDRKMWYYSKTIDWKKCSSSSRFVFNLYKIPSLPIVYYANQWRLNGILCLAHGLYINHMFVLLIILTNGIVWWWWHRFCTIQIPWAAYVWLTWTCLAKIACL